ncbi:hypothetical protein HOL34_02990 [bacterium]|jgi:hypothetical protein|nr:hypothetical protein [bacterium]MBT3903442.1 hypothetical protein [bacterium]MBT4577503.1 hypothetical protein [bacterium]MBT5345781.1 hypothetical protein [bacterium]MBT6130878.1 hypothetical protein [bacterium]
MQKNKFISLLCALFVLSLVSDIQATKSLRKMCREHSRVQKQRKQEERADAKSKKSKDKKRRNNKRNHPKNNK